MCQLHASISETLCILSVGSKKLGDQPEIMLEKAD